VSTEEGTGLVHIAPAFGEDDMKLAHQAKLPIILNVSSEGKFAFTKTELRQEPFFSKIQGRFVKSADPLIFEELKRRGILYSGDLEGAEHEYPFCWRCDSPLLYYAHKSWFVRMSRLKDELLANNSKINWVPAHIKEGRFGEWLREVKDWAFSRDRYWGTPLPIWKCVKCGNIDTVGSVLGLNQKAYKPNKFLIMRHGDADHIRGDYIAAWPEPAGKTSRLTEKGRTEAELAAKALSRKKIDIIVSSDLVRAKETVAILKKNLTGVKVLFDPRLRELNCGIFNYRKISDYRKFFKKPLEKFFKAPSGAETLIDAQKRCFSVWRELNRKYRGRNILLVGHADSLWLLEGKLKGLAPEQILKTKYIAPGEWRELPQNDLPYSDEAELDLHRPYVDELRLECGRCKSEMRRVPEVADVWFDSGAMPFAQTHFPFACAKIQNPNSNPSTSSGLTFSSLSLKVEGLSEAERVKFQNYQKLAQKCLDFPADYIAEGVDQTRGWFYTLLAVSTALGYRVPPFRNVICLGHILDEKGEKMSKSKGNVVNPWEMMAKYGADSLRWYFFTVNSPGEPKRFSEKDLTKSHQELLVLLNVLQFFRTYAPRKISKRNRQKANNPLDKWILARLVEITAEVTANFERYEINQAARQIAIFLDDLSRWYVRRSRRRFQKPGSSKKLAETSAVLAFVLAELAKLLAPFIPFTAEHIWQSVTKRLSGKHSESVHLVPWPDYKALTANKSILVKMQAVRELAALGLKLRQTAGIKVRQPLRTFWVLEKRDSVRISDDFSAILAEELNVKKIEFTRRLPAGSAGLPEGAEIIQDANGKWKAALDIGIGAGLREEGELRELIRNIQELRQAAGFEPKDRIELYIEASQVVKTEISRRSAQLKKEVGAARLIFTRAKKFSAEKEYKRADGATVYLAIKKL
jgi:isoleucyl-tRNA synthetase